MFLFYLLSLVCINAGVLVSDVPREVREQYLVAGPILPLDSGDKTQVLLPSESSYWPMISL